MIELKIIAYNEIGEKVEMPLKGEEVKEFENLSNEAKKLIEKEYGKISS